MTGVPSGDTVYARGAIGRSLARRAPQGTHGRSWLRPVATVEDAVELQPGDPRIPATLADGAPGPSGAGAVGARLRFITGTADGRAAYAAARAAGPAEWMLGFQVQAERRPGGVRVVEDLDVYQLWPRSLVDDATGPGPEVKAAGLRLEVKAGGPARPLRSVRDRPCLPRVVPCTTCRRPAAALIGGGLMPDEALICDEYVSAMTSALDEHVATIDPADLAEAAELTTEQEYERAMADEQEWAMLPDGELVPAESDPQRDGLAWSQTGRRTERAW